MVRLYAGVVLVALVAVAGIVAALNKGLWLPQGSARMGGPAGPPGPSSGRPARIDLPSRSPRVRVSGVPPGGRAKAQGSVRLTDDAGAVPARVTVDGTDGWRLRIPGNRPLATPAVAYGLVYVGGGYGSHEFYALDARSGAIAWKIRTDDDGPTAAVVLDEQVLFNSESCTLYSVDARTGRLRWKKWLGDPLMNQPAAWDGKVYMAYPGSQGQHFLACMEMASGKMLWKQPVQGDIITAPVIDGGRVYLSTLDGSVSTFDAGTGRRHWSRQLRATSAPWVEGESVFVSLREPGKPPPGPGRAWQIGGPRPGGEGVPSESVATLAAGGAGGIQRRQATRPGAEYLTEGWNSKQRKAKDYAAADGAVGFPSAPGAAKLYQARGTIGLNNVSSVWAFQGSRPCVYRGRLYTAQHDLLRCTEAASGRLYWEARFTDTRRFEGGRALLPPALAGGAVYLASATGQVFCLNAASGAVRWHLDVGEPLSFQPAVVDGRVYVATDRGSVFSLDARDPRATDWAMWGGNAQHNQHSEALTLERARVMSGGAWVAR